MIDTDVKVESKKEKRGGKPAPKDLSAFSPGQTLEGKVISVKPFGAFVEVTGGANVLLPRSVISRGGKNTSDFLSIIKFFNNINNFFKAMQS